MRGKGELMAAENFPGLENLDLSPKEVKEVFAFISAQNKRVRKPQFHATLSAKGKEFDKHQLTVMGKLWMEKMGYGKQPYIIIFHSDTNNNHIHLVSTRVSALNGRKINDSFERICAVKYMEEIMQARGYAEHTGFLDYSFQTVNQLKLLYERAGYAPKQLGEELVIFKNFHEHERISFDIIERKKRTYQIDDNRVKKLRALLHKYGKLYSGTLKPQFQKQAGGRQGKTIGYSSDLTDFMKKEFGLEMVFHFKEGKPPYGYTLIDHPQKRVMKGSAVMRMHQLETLHVPKKENKGEPFHGHGSEPEELHQKAEQDISAIEDITSLLGSFGGAGDGDKRKRRKKKNR